jgi:Protein of unknown function, DUF547.
MSGPKLGVAFLLATLLWTPLWSAEKPVATFPPPVDSADWTRLLEKYVDASGLVAYASWKENPEDRKRIDLYLARFSPGGGSPSVATLINAYNAFIIRAILERYPIDGIRSIPGAFTSEAHLIGGRKYSLDEIEHTAVGLGGYRVHATIVCASKSCPPLGRRAYDAAAFSVQEDDRMRAWMSRPDFYRFDPVKNVAKLPKYYDWYRQDFEKAGIPRILSAYAPERYRAWLAEGRFKVEFLDYDWSLNDLQGR